MIKLHLNWNLMTIIEITLPPSKWESWDIICMVLFTAHHSCFSSWIRKVLCKAHCHTKEALVWERECPITLDPLTIFSFLVVHSELTWNKNYWKCISVTREKNPAIVSVLGKISEVHVPRVHSPPGQQCVCALRTCPLLQPHHLRLGHSRPGPCSMWHTPISMNANCVPKASCLAFLLMYPCELTLAMLVSLCRYGLMQLLRYFTP